MELFTYEGEGYVMYIRIRMGNTCDRLMKLKQKELVILTQKMKQYYSNIYNRWFPGQYISGVNRESFYRIQELEKDYVLVI